MCKHESIEIRYDIVNKKKTKRCLICSDEETLDMTDEEVQVLTAQQNLQQNPIA